MITQNGDMAEGTEQLARDYDLFQILCKATFFYNIKY